MKTELSVCARLNLLNISFVCFFFFFFFFFFTYCPSCVSQSFVRPIIMYDHTDCDHRHVKIKTWRSDRIGLNQPSSFSFYLYPPFSYQTVQIETINAWNRFLWLYCKKKKKKKVKQTQNFAYLLQKSRTHDWHLPSLTNDWVTPRRSVGRIW